MGLTLFGLGLVYVVFMAVLIAATGSVVLIVVVAAALFAFQYFSSEALALRAMGGRVVSPQEEPALHALIERLCVQADLPKPKVAVAEDRQPNAFALGRSPKHAVVCATRGIMDLLSPAELEGVMAHELSHVANRDVAIMTLASFFASIAAFILQWGFLFGGMFGGGGGGRDRNDNGPGFAVVLLASVLVYAISFVLMRTLSRYREFAADRGSAVMTGRPSALSSALMKISSGQARIPQQDLRQQQMAAFYISPVGAKQAFGNLFSTHPTMEARIERLSRLEAQLQSGR